MSTSATVRADRREVRGTPLSRLMKEPFARGMQCNRRARRHVICRLDSYFGVKRNHRIACRSNNTVSLIKLVPESHDGITFESRK